ncbi:MAG: phosphatase PAP2 family protein, partial [Bdellovibrionota bacterium]|nr:phosphatase PAP2 family protein [Bdellovibrionota bacterium]
FFASSLFFGFLMGVGRMADGAHFFSDVLWSAIMVFLPAYYLHQLLLERKSKEAFKKNIRLAVLQAGVLIIALIGAVLLATPYKQIEVFEFKEEKLSIKVPKGNFIFKENSDLGDSSLKMSMKARGFGFPGSLVKLAESGEEKEFFIDGLFTDFELIYEVSYGEKIKSLKLMILTNGKVKDQENLPEFIQILHVE